MKKIVAAVVALLFFLSFTNFTVAQAKSLKTAKPAKEKTEIITGKVVSVDKAAKTIIVKDNKTQVEKSFVVSEKAVTTVKVGNEVKIKAVGLFARVLQHEIDHLDGVLFIERATKMIKGF